MTGAVNVPIFQTSTYAQEGRTAQAGLTNIRAPTTPYRQAYEQCLAARGGQARDRLRFRHGHHQQLHVFAQERRRGTRLG